MLEALQLLKNTLCKVEIKGQENMEYLLGCIHVLNDLIRKIGETDNERDSNSQNGSE